MAPLTNKEAVLEKLVSNAHRDHEISALALDLQIPESVVLTALNGLIQEGKAEKRIWPGGSSQQATVVYGLPEKKKAAA